MLPLLILQCYNMTLVLTPQHFRTESFHGTDLGLYWPLKRTFHSRAAMLSIIGSLLFVLYHSTIATSGKSSPACITLG